MKKALKKILSFMLCFVLIFGTTGISKSTETTVSARTIFDIESELNEYKAMLAKLQSELSVIAGNIKEIEGKSGQTTELMAQYQAEIDALDAEMLINQSIMDSYDMKRAEVISEIAIIEEDYNYRVSMYKKLMQFIYENSSMSSFELLFSSDNVAEYLTRRDNFNDIMNAANALIKEIEVSIADLESLNNELAETQGKYNEYLTELNLKKIEKEAKIKDFETIAEELNLDGDALSAEYRDKNATIKEVKQKIATLEEERREAYSSTSEFLWPIQGSYMVTSYFGWRSDPFGSGATKYHSGLDIASPRGTPIIAVKSGVVTRAEFSGGYGNCVSVYHGNGLSTLYAHCDYGNGSRPTFNVSVGQSVKAGDVLAYVGTTGSSTGYHLHFEVIDTNTYTALSGNRVNPDLYLPDGYYNKRS